MTPDAVATLAPMTPGTYLRLRRTAARLSALELARRLYPRAAESAIAASRALIERVEADEVTIGATFSRTLAQHIAMDSEIFDRLTAIFTGADIPLPQICRTCGCSWNDPCQDEWLDPCAWSVSDPNLCTHCERRHAA